MSKGIEYLNSSEKRALDISGAVLFLVPGLSVAGLSAVALSREVGGLQNTIFLQRRIINGDRRVIIPKLRTIHPKHTEGKPPVNMGVLDPRAGKVGKFVRQLGLDETPQALSVLRGHLSLVGPRPRPEFEMEEYEAADPELYGEWREFINSVKPGLFGLSQVMRHMHPDCPSEEVLAESMRLELAYRDEASLRTDLEIMMGTPDGLIKAAQNSYRESQAQPI